MTILTNGLETTDYGQQGWNAVHTANMEKLDEAVGGALNATYGLGEQTIADIIATTAATLTDSSTGTPTTTIGAIETTIPAPTAATLTDSSTGTASQIIGPVTGALSAVKKQVAVVKESNRSGSIINNHIIYNMGATVTSWIAFAFTVPDNWDTGTDPQIRIYGFTNSTGTSQNYRFEFGMQYNSDGAIVDGVEDETVTYTQPAHDTDEAVIVGTKQSLDRTLIAAGDHISVQFRRLGGDALDDRASDFRFLRCEIEFTESGTIAGINNNFASVADEINKMIADIAAAKTVIDAIETGVNDNFASTVTEYNKAKTYQGTIKSKIDDLLGKLRETGGCGVFGD